MNMNPIPRPDYEALDDIGLPYVRKARIIDELPLEMKDTAAIEATASIAKLIGVEAQGRIKHAPPVFMAFGINRNIAKRHVHAKVLLLPGGDVPLDFCPSFEADAQVA